LVDYLANVGGIKDSFVPGRVAKDQCKFNIRNGWEISFGSVCVCAVRQKLSGAKKAKRLQWPLKAIGKVAGSRELWPDID
jgi:hypothetical protein